MGALILALILIVGYHYQSFHPIRQMELARSSGYHIYFKAGISGSILFFASLAVWFFVDYFDLPSQVLEFFITEQRLTYLKAQENWSYFKGAAIACLMFVISCLYCWACGFIYKSEEKRFKHVVKIANEFEQLIINATYGTAYLRIELSCGKVYVGIPSSPELENGELTYINILPFLSGYRGDGNKILFTTNYESHYARIALEETRPNLKPVHNILDFYIVLPVKNITIASNFDIDAYVAIQSSDSSISKPHTKKRVRVRP
jgi:hypothetical protein